MAAHGERDKPLINTEMGIHIKAWVDILLQRNKSMIISPLPSILCLQHHNQIGYPADENRLVQGWIGIA